MGVQSLRSRKSPKRSWQANRRTLRRLRVPQTGESPKTKQHNKITNRDKSKHQIAPGGASPSGNAHAEKRAKKPAAQKIQSENLKRFQHRVDWIKSKNSKKLREIKPTNSPTSGSSGEYVLPPRGECAPPARDAPNQVSWTRPRTREAEKRLKNAYAKAVYQDGVFCLKQMGHTAVTHQNQFDALAAVAS